jgi:diacylglycerol diphosphate phosphatase / phosphatidate phosphatase
MGQMLKVGRFLIGQFHGLRPGANMIKVIICGLPALGALLITLSRTEDYRHDIYDVSAGTTIGSIVAYYSYVCSL